MGKLKVLLISISYVLLGSYRDTECTLCTSTVSSHSVAAPHYRLPGLRDMNTLFSCFLKQADKGRVLCGVVSVWSHNLCSTKAAILYIPGLLNLRGQSSQIIMCCIHALGEIASLAQ